MGPTGSDRQHGQVLGHKGHQTTLGTQRGRGTPEGQHCKSSAAGTEGPYRDLSQMYLPAPGLDHELPGQVWGWLRLQRPDDDALVQGVTRHNLKYRARMGARCWGWFNLLETPTATGNTPGPCRHPQHPVCSPGTHKLMSLLVIVPVRSH